MIRFRSPLNLTSVSIAIVTTIAGFALIPAGTIMPVHWGIDGRIDGTMPRDLALIVMPVTVAFIWGLFAAIDRFTSPNKRAASAALVNVAISSTTALFTLIQVLLVLIALGVPVDLVRAIVIALALMEIAIGNVMPKSQPNRIAGIRLPSTLNDPANWQAVHRLTGLLTVICGVALFVVALLIQSAPLLFLALAVSWVVPLAVGIIYSLLLQRRQPS